jgi:hypothetical protein
MKQGFFELHSSHLKFGNNSKTLRKETSNHNAALGDVQKVSTFKMAADSSHLVARFQGSSSLLFAIQNRDGSLVSLSTRDIILCE